MRKSAIYILLFLATIELSIASCQSPCVATPLSLVEASELVKSVAAALSAQSQGGIVEADNWEPRSFYNRDFYYFMLQTPAGTAKTLLDNGLIGYFAVNIKTGRVVNVVTGNEEFSEALKQIQTVIRRRHCIDKDVVLRNQSTEP